MEAGSYCRTLKCLCWDLLQKRFFGRPSSPFPPNASCHRSFVALAPCPQTCGQCRVGACMAGSGQAEAQPEKPHQSKDSPHSPSENHSQALLTQEDPAQPQCSAALLSHPTLWAAWSRNQGYTSVLMVLVPLCSLSSLVPPSMALASIQPGWTPAPNVEKSWRALPHVSAPQRLPRLFQSGDSAGPLPPLPLHPCASPSRRCCSRAGSFLHRREAEDSLQTKDSAVATWSPMTTVTFAGVATSGMGRHWSCAFMAQLTLSPSSPSITGQAHH